MQTIKRKLLTFSALLVLCAVLCIEAYATSGTVLWAVIEDKKAVVYLPQSGDVTECQIGTSECSAFQSTAISDSEKPIETLILIDNSLSIPKNERTVVVQILENLIGNRMQGELFTIATISDDIHYLCTHESDYLSLGSAISSITYENQDTQLTDNLYKAIESLHSDSPTQFSRIVVISDGVDDKEIGYTRAELQQLIQTCGYPIYTVGCGSNDTSERKTKLENLFALSRINAGESLYLGENSDTFAIAKTICEYNTAQRVTIALPDELCDGTTRAIKITCGGQDYTVQIAMPFSLAPTAAPTNKPASTPAATQAAEGTVTKYDKRTIIIIAIAGVAILALAAAVIVSVRLRVKKAKSAPEPEIKQPKPAEEIINPINKPDPKSNFNEWWKPQSSKHAAASPKHQMPADDEATSRIFPQKNKPATPKANKRILKLVDTNDAFRTFEVPIDGRVLIGRDQACRISIDDASVSHRQCEIYSQDGTIYIVNCSKTNITQMNGLCVEKATPLLNGSVLKMGRVSMKVVIS